MLRKSSVSFAPVLRASGAALALRACAPAEDGIHRRRPMRRRGGCWSGSAGNGCMGPLARIFLHDMNDPSNQFSASEKARDCQLTQNGCDKAMAPVAVDPSPCVNYPGCPAAYPVVWCPTTGQMHGRQDNVAPAAFWNFFKKV